MIMTIIVLITTKVTSLPGTMNIRTMIKMIITTMIMKVMTKFTSLPGTLPLPFECSVFESLFGSGEEKDFSHLYIGIIVIFITMFMYSHRYNQDHQG